MHESGCRCGIRVKKQTHNITFSVLIQPYLQCMHWSESMRVIIADLFLTILNYLTHELNRFVPPAKASKRDCKIIHTDQHFSDDQVQASAFLAPWLIPPASSSASFRRPWFREKLSKVSHAHRHVGMLKSQQLLSCLHDLHSYLLGVLPPALIEKY